MDSAQFSGQKHTWRLSSLLQKGADRSAQTLNNDLAHALKFIGNTETRDPVSLSASLVTLEPLWSPHFRSIAAIFHDWETAHICLGWAGLGRAGALGTIV